MTDNTMKHWTGKPNTMLGTVHIDGTPYTFMGKIANQDYLHQVDCLLTALSTKYVFEGAGIRLTARFMTPLLLDDLKLLSRPVSFLELSAVSIDGKDHRIEVDVSVSEEICLNAKGQYPVKTSIFDLQGYAAASIGSIEQPVLAKSGDDFRADWGYFYFSVKDGCSSIDQSEDMTFVKITAPISIDGTPNVVAFAYDDCYAIEYFGKRLKSMWNQSGNTISDAVADAFDEYEVIKERCDLFDKGLQTDAVEAGGAEYADLLHLAYRQTIAAHKLAVDENDEILWISKECFSNGCAATVDVTYPSLPLFLLYNTELVKGMLRPIFKYVESDLWKFDFAPHDVGQYPLLNGQVYCDNQLEGQMPIEECGNMILAVAAITIAERNVGFANRHMAVLEQWFDYLCNNGLDPENQLCTDDFAGHLAHNCNLSLKAICAIGSFSRVYHLMGNFVKAEHCIKTARNMAAEWTLKATNGDGSFRLAFDCPDTFSMKYNMVWDKLMKLQLFPPCVMGSEIASYACRMRPYGLPFDNRSDYTKSDWLVWTATMTPSIEQFRAFINPLWRAYHLSPSRVPTTYWYDTITSMQTGFQNRTVQGGLFMKLLDYRGLEKNRYVPLS